MDGADTGEGFPPRVRGQRGLRHRGAPAEEPSPKGAPPQRSRPRDGKAEGVTLAEGPRQGAAVDGGSHLSEATVEWVHRQWRPTPSGRDVE